MFNKIFMWALLIVPWFTLLFMKKESIKHYAPVVVFTALMVTVTQEMAYTFKWWLTLDKIVPWGNITNISYSYGGFLVVTFWIFHFTNKKFWRYLLVNIIFDGLWVFPIIHFLESRHIFQYGTFNEWACWLLAVSQAILQYGFQLWFDRTFELRGKERQE